MTKAAELAKMGEVLTNSQIGGRRNIVINGSASVAQRGDVTGITGESYGGPDRFELAASNIGTFTVSQSSTAPTGFKNSYKVDCTTADASLGSEDLLRVAYRIEGQDLQQLAYGTSSANTITLSFYVRSNKTGTYNIQFQQADNSSKQAVVSYTISSANTWEFKTITVQGDTSGVINDDNGEGLTLFWVLGAGSLFTSGSERSTYTAFSNGDVAPTQTVNLADNTANEWMITGVQLEVNSQATPFEHRSFGEELALCQRYCFHHPFQSVGGNTFIAGQLIPSTTTAALGYSVMPVPLRATPTLSFSALAATRVGLITTDTMAGDTTTAYLAHQLEYRISKRAAPTVVIYDQAEATGKVTSHVTGVSTANGQTASTEHAGDKSISVLRASGDAANGFRFHYTADAEL